MIKVNFIDGNSLDISDSISFIHEIYKQIYVLTSNNHKIFIQGTEEELPLNTEFNEDIHSILFALPYPEHNDADICISIELYSYEQQASLNSYRLGSTESGHAIKVNSLIRGYLCSYFLGEDYGSNFEDDIYPMQELVHSFEELNEPINLEKYKFNIDNKIVFTWDKSIMLNNTNIITASNNQYIIFDIDNLKKLISKDDYDKLEDFK